LRTRSEPGRSSAAEPRTQHSSHVPAEAFLRIQQTWGNQAVQRMLTALVVAPDRVEAPPKDQSEPAPDSIDEPAIRSFDSPAEGTASGRPIPRRSSQQHRSSTERYATARSNRSMQAAEPNLLQRKILVGGQEISSEQKIEVRGQYALDKPALELFERMDNGGKSPDYAFANLAQLKTEIEVRRNAIKGMEEIHKGCCRYPALNEAPYIDKQYWQQKSTYQFVPVSPFPPGKEASDAIEAIFKPDAKTLLDCWTIMVAVEYYALLKGLGKTKFNQKFPAGAGMEISWRGTSNFPASGGPNVIFNQYDSVNVASETQILSGDWVYFKNFADYTTVHPGGYWQGENAIYMGEGKYQGFGSGLKTKDEMEQMLVDAYNSGLAPQWQRNVTGLRAFGGGLLLTGVNRPKRM
jgi:Protein-glutamine gamma-glutamyltransferase